MGHSDVDIWERLDSGGEGLVDALRALAETAPSGAWPIYARAQRWLRNPDPKVRAAAHAAFVGATGYRATEARVAALDDGERIVRDAALAALLQGSATNPDVLVAALYHPRTDVREAAFAGRLTSVGRHLLVPLLAAPAVSDQVHAELDSKDLDPLTAARLVRITTRGHADPQWVAGRLATLNWARSAEAICQHFETSRTIEPVCLDPTVFSAHCAGHAAAVDSLDAVFAILRSAPAYFDEVIDALSVAAQRHLMPPALSDRVAWSLLSSVPATSLSPPALALIARTEPFVLE